MFKKENQRTFVNLFSCKNTEKYKKIILFFENFKFVRKCLIFLRKSIGTRLFFKNKKLLLKNIYKNKEIIKIVFRVKMVHKK